MNRKKWISEGKISVDIAESKKLQGCITGKRGNDIPV
jgi:hypothetical protein